MTLRLGPNSVLLLFCLTLAILAAAPSASTQTPRTITLQMSNGYALLSVTGDVGSGCTIQSVTNLSSNWQFVTNFTVLSNQSLLVDPASPVAAQRFYRVYSQPVPTNIVATNMVWITPGTFTMGSPPSEALRYSAEGPQTLVTISRGFGMGRYAVTQGEYAALMGNNPSYFNTQDDCGNPISPDLNRPVEMVSWNDAVAYCTALTTRERIADRLPAGYVYRLPTEGEWEYACRAGTTTAFYYGPALRSGMANFFGVYEYDSSIGSIYNAAAAWLCRTATVGSYAPNPWGLCDMHGNVWEWCQDWWLASLPGGSVNDPTGPGIGSARVLRGGSWDSAAQECRSAFRSYDYPTDSQKDIGFRVVLAIAQP